MQHKTQQITANETIQYEDFSFGAFDKKGREIGAIVTTYEVDFIPFVEDPERPYRGYYTRAPGHYYAAVCQATRNGNHYGAGQGANLYDTPSERAEGIAKYLKSARKRAEKVA